MTKTARVYTIESLIRTRGHVSFAQLLEALEVSPATLKRDLDYLRDQLGAPIVYDRDVNGYRFGPEYRGHKHELPGMWFSERELYSLLMAHQLLSELDTEGMISRHLQPLLDRIHQMLGGDASAAQALLQRVRIISPAKRPVAGPHFERVGEALVERRRLQLRYLTRGRGAVGDREVSPQRLVHYRNTWYLDAWCHQRERLLRFALDAMQAVQVLATPARELPIDEVRAQMDAGYGIYAGSRAQWARLRFDAQAAAWVSREEWHPQQRGRWLPDGAWELELPFSNETELVMDILRHGPQVRVMAPASLMRSVAVQLQQAALQYGAEVPDGGPHAEPAKSRMAKGAPRPAG
ncbi:MAG: WYL domain-containing protein [Aquabacterium sp.]|jgi:predicted DNA-binding transcriptional regulator YafY|nr:WYL domain-containing protein [Aquabacterium sp.]